MRVATAAEAELTSWIIIVMSSDAVISVFESAQRLVFYCRTTSASTAPCTSRRMCCTGGVRERVRVRE